MTSDWGRYFKNSIAVILVKNGVSMNVNSCQKLEFCPYKEMGVAKKGMAKIFTIAAHAHKCCMGVN